MTHAEVRELIPCYALGALEEGESVVVREHLVECGFCANLAREASDVAHYLPYASRFRTPPAGSLDRLLAAIASDKSTPQPAAAAPPPVAASGAPQPAASSLERRLERWLELLRTPVFTPVAALLVLVLGMAGWNMSLMGELKEERRQMSTLQGRLAQQTHLLVMVSSGSSVSRPLAGTALAPSAEVRLIMDGETNTAMVMAARMPPLPVDRVYQVWLGRQGARMPAGRFVVDEQGDGECSLQLDSSVHSYDSAWITLEPMQGAPLPNSPGVAKGQLQ